MPGSGATAWLGWGRLLRLVLWRLRALCVLRLPSRLYGDRQSARLVDDRGPGSQAHPESQLRCLLRPDRFRVLGPENIGDEAVEYLKRNVRPLDLAFRLAEVHG